MKGAIIGELALELLSKNFELSKSDLIAVMSEAGLLMDPTNLSLLF